MNLQINPISSLNGEINAPPSKSYSHRAFIAASLSNGVSIIKNPLTDGDVLVTIELLKELNINIVKKSENSYLVERTKNSFKPIYKILNCKNSGTSIRIFSALSLLVEGGLIFSGEFLKRSRPMEPLLNAIKRLGADYKFSRNTLHIKRIQKFCNRIEIPGDISSQFITSLLFLSPVIKCNNSEFIEIQITTPLVSYPYIKITLEVLSSFGIKIYEKLNDDKTGKYVIETKQKFRPQVYNIPGDFSSAAFIIAASILSPNDSKVIIKNLNIKDPQGDKKLIEILNSMGSKIELDEINNTITVFGGINKYPLKGIMIDCRDIPDLFPILAVIGTFAEGKTVLYNASNLRLKESDRIKVMARELNKMGVNIEENDDGLVIFKSQLNGIEIKHENDHRIAMACIIASLYANSNSTIENAEIVRDSYPTFIDDLLNLGANFNF